MQKGIRDIQHGKMPRRLLHATCGVTSITVPPNSSIGISNSRPNSRSNSRPNSRNCSPSPRITKPTIFDDFDSYTIDHISSKDEESFG